MSDLTLPEVERLQAALESERAMCERLHQRLGKALDHLGIDWFEDDTMGDYAEYRHAQVMAEQSDEGQS